MCKGSEQAFIVSPDRIQIEDLSVNMEVPSLIQGLAEYGITARQEQSSPCG